MPSGADSEEFRTRAAELIEAGRSLYARGMLSEPEPGAAHPQASNFKAIRL